MSNVLIFENLDQICNEITKDIFRIYNETINNNNSKFNLAISGGNTPKKLFEFISKEYKNKFNWTHIHIYWVDERCVSPNSDESNYFMTKKYLLDKIAIPNENIHRIRGESDPDKEVLRYTNELRQNINFINNYPNFDYILLGMGNDGHTASVFPNNLKDINSNEICLKALKSENNQFRISLSIPTINNAKFVSFMITGSDKAIVLKKVIENNNESYPASFVSNSNLKFFLDKESGHLLDIK